MDNTFQYYSKIYGNKTHIQSQGYEGMSNYNMIADNTLFLFKKYNCNFFIIKFIKHIDEKYNVYQFIKTSLKSWANEYVNDDTIVAFVHIEYYNEKKQFLISGKIKSDTNYCCINKIIC